MCLQYFVIILICAIVEVCLVIAVFAMSGSIENETRKIITDAFAKDKLALLKIQQAVLTTLLFCQTPHTHIIV
jgi:hypothetical protein